MIKVLHDQRIVLLTTTLEAVKFMSFTPEQTFITKNISNFKALGFCKFSKGFYLCFIYNRAFFRSVRKVIDCCFWGHRRLFLLSTMFMTASKGVGSFTPQISARFSNSSFLRRLILCLVLFFISLPFCRVCLIILFAIQRHPIIRETPGSNEPKFYCHHAGLACHNLGKKTLSGVYAVANTRGLSLTFIVFFIAMILLAAML